ncbi:MAG TPA: DUF4397 domain-containing protein [Gemmatimonadaceae bacterium]|nr:DUF4397 domain-containing protein [Gemmatimonadaceae bacterium]
MPASSPCLAPRTRQRAPILALATVATVFAACASEGAVGPIGKGNAAGLSVINGAPGAVRVVVDGTTRIGLLEPASVSAAIDLPEGAHSVELQAIGSGTFSGTSTAQVTIRPAGVAFVAAQASALGALVANVVSDTGAVPAPGMSKLRVIHLASGAPRLDVWRTQPDYQTPIRTMFPFPYTAQSSFLQSTPGAWEVIVTPATQPTPGEADPRTLALARLVLTIGANTARTVVILDKVGGGVTLSALPGN